DRDDPRGDVLPALSLGPAVRLLQERQQPDPRRPRSAVAATRAQGGGRPPAKAPRARLMNRIEAMKAARDGLDVQADLIRFAREGWRTIADDDKERLKWVGVFHRKA